MKFLIIQENGRHRLNKNYRECFCIQRALSTLGHSSVIYGKGHEKNNFDELNFDDYDVIMNLENYDDTGWVPNLKSYKKPVKILWSIDAHCRGVEVYKHENERGAYNLVLQSTPEYVDQIDNSIWFPNCFDDTLIKPLHIDKKYEVGFCGNYPTIDRKTFLDELSKIIEIKRDIFVIGDEMVKSINSYKRHWNKNMSIDINYRNFETLGCGTLLLTNYNPHYPKLGLINRENCLIYNNLEECVRLIQDNSIDINKIASQGYEVSKKHTYLERFSNLIQSL